MHLFRVIILSVVLSTTLGLSAAQANLCQDFFDTRLEVGLKENEFGTLAFHTGTGRNVLSTGHLLGSMTENGVTIHRLSMGSGGVRDFNTNSLFHGIEPFRARTIVTDPNDSLKREDERIVTVVAVRTSPNPKDAGAHQYIARLAGGKLVRVVRLIAIPAR